MSGTDSLDRARPIHPPSAHRDTRSLEGSASGIPSSPPDFPSATSQVRHRILCPANQACHFSASARQALQCAGPHLAHGGDATCDGSARQWSARSARGRESPPCVYVVLTAKDTRAIWPDYDARPSASRYLPVQTRTKSSVLPPGLPTQCFGRNVPGVDCAQRTPASRTSALLNGSTSRPSRTAFRISRMRRPSWRFTLPPLSCSQHAASRAAVYHRASRCRRGRHLGDHRRCLCLGVEVTLTLRALRANYRPRPPPGPRGPRLPSRHSRSWNSWFSTSSRSCS